MTDYARAPHQGPGTAAHRVSPNAALLIDFDNVTMGIRSDLTKELKNLLNSDIIKGKVAVQRAYADWRRYPQYIVPLSEASIDLIFAPAYGSSKKNATDIRLAIDALELVFTRPEIGNFILLSGDSDFSSLVLKLKEYGKYVIGVGLRESASDLLVQNCDEYYSYSGLTGLTKAGDEQRSAEDPWVLVERAVGKMEDDRDVMRSDRLKQVMLELDPSFDEKTLGFSKFNKFLAEASNRNCLKLRKMENGQYEVASFAVKKDGGEAGEKERRQESRERRRQPRERKKESRGERAPAQSRKAPERGPQPEPRRPPSLKSSEDLPAAYDLLKRAVQALIDDGRDVARDSDVKRKILEISPNWDESEYGFQKFSRFLRQAHDAEAVTLRRTPEGYYEVMLPEQTGADEQTGGRDREQRRGRGRRQGRDGRQESRPEAGAREEAEATGEPAAARETEAAPSEDAEAERDAEDAEAGRDAEDAEVIRAVTPPGEGEQAEEAPEPEPTRTRSVRMRRGSRAGGPRGEGKPPILPGQTVGTAGASDGDEAKVEPEPEAAPAEQRDDAEEPAEATEAPAPTPGATVFQPEQLGLPTESGAVIRYLANSYKGVGEKTAEQLIEAFGADRVFEALETQPERVREVLGAGRRTEQLLDAWESDHARRVSGEDGADGAGNGDAASGAEPRGGAGETAATSGNGGAGRGAPGTGGSDDGDRPRRTVGVRGRRGARG